MTQSETDLFEGHVPQQPPEQEQASVAQEEQAAESTSHEKAPAKQGEQQTGLQLWEDFKQKLEQEEGIEAKLKLSVEFMEVSLSQDGSANFKNFWEARKGCLELFKDDALSPSLRFPLWHRFTELSKEANRLKEVLDEQSKFASEQIDIAIQALEKDILQLESLLKESDSVDFTAVAKSFEDKIAHYQPLQGELQLLNAYAMRINSLRKELIKTDMRIRVKNRFFQRLSEAGNKVFPRRKQLIQEVSDLFTRDIEAFVKVNFSKQELKGSLFSLRDEIKSLQGMAKILTLNTAAFTETRMRLSECWDKIKKVERERKKYQAEQKVVFKQHAEEVHQKIQEFLQEFPSLSVADAQTKLKEVSLFMKGQTLGYEEVRALREEMAQARKLLEEKEKQEDEVRQKAKEEREQQKREQFLDFQQRLQTLLEQEGCEVEALQSQSEAFNQEMKQLPLTKADRLELDKLFKALKDKIAEQKEQALLNLPADKRESLERLQEVLAERRSRYQETKEQLKAYRKANGASGLDFQKAMELNELINAEEERLQKIEEGIEEIEEKIEEIQNT